jgi:nicotinamide-nucleotide amidase
MRPFSSMASTRGCSMSDAATLVTLLKDQSGTLALAESCTGGMIATAITDISGSSAVFDRGFVTYSNAAKMDMLGVSASIIENHGAVSSECAAAMAEGALNNSVADITLSVTGIAGPGGGSDDKPVGLVHFGLITGSTDTKTQQIIFKGDRTSVRNQARDYALSMLIEALS